MRKITVLAAIVLAIAAGANAQMSLPTDKIESELVAKYGEAQRARAHRGLQQVAEFWRPADGDAAAFDPYAHFADDMFADKLAFTVLLNFPLTTLQQRLTEGDHWTRRQWAEAKLALTFAHRIPADVNQAVSKA